MTIGICLILSFIAAWYSLKPFFTDSVFSDGVSTDSKLDVLLDQKNRSVYMLRDLELDYTTGKLSDEEYNVLKEELSLELSEVIKRIDKGNADTVK